VPKPPLLRKPPRATPTRGVPPPNRLMVPTAPIQSIVLEASLALSTREQKVNNPHDSKLYQ
jgi:hypothetical protein